MVVDWAAGWAGDAVAKPRAAAATQAAEIALLCICEEFTPNCGFILCLPVHSCVSCIQRPLPDRFGVLLCVSPYAGLCPPYGSGFVINYYACEPHRFHAVGLKPRPFVESR